jgi:hypothetical protein
MPKVRCKVCGATSDIEPGRSLWDIRYARGRSPYGGDFPHPRLDDCPLTRGIRPEEILEDKDIEEIGE